MLRLSLFVATFLAIYAGMHLAVWFGLRPLLAGRTLPALLLGVLMLAMILAPLGIRGLERLGQESAARGLALAGYGWMGFLFLAFVGFGLVYLWDLLLTLLTSVTRNGFILVLHGPKTALAVLGLAAAVSIYGAFEAANLRVERIRIETPKLPEGRERLRIIQISDLHLGLIHRHRFLQDVTARIAPLQPDLLVVTGDLVDAQIDHLDGLSELFAALKPPLGKYAVTGNHEVYAGLRQASAFIRRSGFELLRNRSVQATPGLTVLGIDDPAAGTRPDEPQLLQQAPGSDFVLLLKHRPWIAEHASGHFDLQLSGHSHRGQIAPFNLLTHLFYPLQNGLYPVAPGAFLYTSRGTGTWGPPMRVLSPPEITVIDLVPPGT
jgi:predicted MPP superfamily phosphohydrolase